MLDDQLTACNSRSALDAFKHTLNNKFECSDSGPAGYFLGFSIYRDRPARKLHLSQQHYLEAILDRFDLVDCNPARSPLPYGFRPIPATDEEHQAARHRAYPQAVGAILYASTVSRPDLSRAASVLSRFISKWNETGKQPNTCFATSAAHPTSVLPLRQNLVTELPWVMQMQTGGVTWTLNALLPAMSSRSMAALLRGKAGVSQPLLCLLPKQSTWHQQMQHDRLSGLPLDDLQLGLGNKPFPIMNDDAGTIALSKNPVNHERSKHIGLRHHFLRERVEDKTISLSHVPSADNSADLLTKGLPRELFDRLRDLLGVTARSDRVGVSG